MSAAVGRRYATALLQLAQEQKQLDAVSKELADLSAVWNESEELRTVVANPTLPRAAIKKIIFAVLERVGAGTLVKNTAGLLADRGRLALLPSVIEAFQMMAEALTGSTRVEVTTATVMPDSYYAELQKTLQDFTGTKVVLVKKHDPSIIAGVVTRIGDRVIDGSVRNRLHELKDELLAAGRNQSAN